MIVTQKKASNKAVFTFEDEGLRYSIKDPSGTNSFYVEYEGIPPEHSELEERNAWFRNIGGLWTILGLVVLAMQFSRGSVGFPTWLVIGLACLGYYWYASTKFSVFSTHAGRIFVIQDGQHEEIVEELRKRKTTQLRNRYAKILDVSEADQEAARFQWLFKEQIISKEEYEDLMAGLRLGAASLRPYEGP
jgi:hypothetical protein